MSQDKWTNSRDNLPSVHFTDCFNIRSTEYAVFCFQFMIDCSQSVFKLEATCGLLAGKGSQTIVIHFSPSKPINYYRRLTCLVQNQASYMWFYKLVLCSTVKIKHGQRIKILYLTHCVGSLNLSCIQSWNFFVHRRKLRCFRTSVPSSVRVTVLKSLSFLRKFEAQRNSNFEHN